MLHTKFQISGQSGSEEEEDFLKYLYAFIWFAPRPLAGGHLGSWDLHLNKIGKGLLGNATYQFQASKPNGSEDEEF